MTNNPAKQIHTALRALLIEARTRIRSASEKILWYQIMMSTRDAQDAARRHADPAIAIDDLREMRQWVIAHRSTCHGVASRLAEYDTAEIMINNTIGILSQIK